MKTLAASHQAVSRELGPGDLEVPRAGEGPCRDQALHLHTDEFTLSC